jgi:hypothetical protein
MTPGAATTFRTTGRTCDSRKVYCIINTEAHPDAIAIVAPPPINEKLVKLGRFIRYVGRSMAPNNWY